jgi:hypothetical protein
MVVKTMAGKVTTFSFAFVCLVTLGTYTAKTAALLTNKAQTPATDIRDVSDIVRLGYDVCASQKDGQLLPTVRNRYSVLSLYSHCTHTVLILYSYCTHTVLTHSYSYCTHTPTHTVLTLYSHCTRTVLVLYSLY